MARFDREKLELWIYAAAGGLGFGGACGAEAVIGSLEAVGPGDIADATGCDDCLGKSARCRSGSGCGGARWGARARGVESNLADREAVAADDVNARHDW